MFRNQLTNSENKPPPSNTDKLRNWVYIIQNILWIMRGCLCTAKKGGKRLKETKAHQNVLLQRALGQDWGWLSAAKTRKNVCFRFSSSFLNTKPAPIRRAAQRNILVHCDPFKVCAFLFSFSSSLSKASPLLPKACMPCEQ